MLRLFVTAVIIYSYWTSYALASSYGHTSANFNGVHFKFGIYNILPFVNIRPGPNGDNDTIITGSSVKTFQWLADKLNFTHSYVIINETAIAAFGSTNRLLLQLVLDKEVDVTGVGQIPTPERLKIYDSAYSLMTEQYSMIVPRPSDEENQLASLFSFVKPFQKLVWLLLLVVMIAIVVSMTLFSKLYSSEALDVKRVDSTRPASVTRKKKLISELATNYFIYAIESLTNHGREMMDDRGFSFRTLIGVWLLVATVLVNSYSSVIISFLTVPTTNPSINTFEDLAASRDVRLVVFKDVILTQQILEAKSGVFKLLGDQVRKNSDQMAESLTEINTKLLTERFAYCNLQTYCKFFVANRFKSEGKCRFRSTDPLAITAGMWSLFLAKNSKFTSSFNIALMELWESGQIQFWVANELPAAPKCFEKIKARTTSARLGPIKLTHLTGVFFILGVGGALSTLVFVCELVLNTKHQPKTTLVAAL